MITQATLDLVTKLKTLPDFGTAPIRVGAAVGGKAIDPTLNNVALPAAWVIFVGDENIEPGEEGDCGPQIRWNFIVKIILEYGSEADLLNNQYPTLVNSINAVNGQEGPVGAKKWRYNGQQIDELSGNRIVFDQRYSIVGIL